MRKEKRKNKDKSGWSIPAFLLIGIGLGFLLVDRIPMAIPAFTLIGLGLGFLVGYVFSKKK